jgi:hypothetical protein
MRSIEQGMYVDFKQEVLDEIYRLPPENPFMVTGKHTGFFTADNRTWHASHVSKVYTRDEYPELYL